MLNTQTLGSMINIILIIILSRGSFQLLAQNGQVIKGNRYRGAIFPSTYQMPYRSNSPEDLRFTPTSEEIALLEKQLKKEIKAINKDKRNQGPNFGPIIHRNLNKYVRQYIGFITPEGDRIIYVNFLWNHLNIFERIKGYSLWAENYDEDWITVHDGGSRYWQIKFNLGTKKFIDFYVNGVA